MNNPMFRILNIDLKKSDFEDIHIDDDDASDFRDLETEESKTYYFFIDDKNSI